jgi:hypothetical protein
MTRNCFLTAAFAVLLGVGGISVTRAAEPALTKKGLKAAIETAKAPQDHLRIAAYYKGQANRMLAEATEHDELAASYAKAGDPHATKHPMAGPTADHCKHFAEAARKAAQASQELAKLHEEMAKPAR